MIFRKSSGSLFLVSRHCPGVRSIFYFPLSIPTAIYRLNYFLISFSLVFKYIGNKNVLQRRSIHKPLALRYLWNFFLSFYIFCKAFHKSIFAKNALRLYFLPYRPRFSAFPHKFPVSFFRYFSLRSKLLRSEERRVGK